MKYRIVSFSGGMFAIQRCFWPFVIVSVRTSNLEFLNRVLERLEARDA